MGSREMTLGLGSGIGAISTTSISETGVSHDDVGEMVVGRVRVAVNIYETVPRSNCIILSGLSLGRVVPGTYVYTAWQSFGRKLQLEVEMIDALA
jgi:hypothetical protein